MLVGTNFDSVELIEAVVDCPVCGQSVVESDFDGEETLFCCHCGFEGGREDFD